MAKPLRSPGSLQAGGALDSIAGGGDGAYAEFDGVRVRFGAKGGSLASWGVAIATLIAGVVTDVLTFGADGAALFRNSISAAGRISSNASLPEDNNAAFTNTNPVGYGLFSQGGGGGGRYALAIYDKDGNPLFDILASGMTSHVSHTVTGPHGDTTLRGGANFPGGALDVATAACTYSNNFAIGDVGSCGFVFISTESGAMAVIGLGGALHQTYLGSALNDTWGVTSHTAGSPSHHNVYWDAATSQYLVENWSGVTQFYAITRVGQFRSQ